MAAGDIDGDGVTDLLIGQNQAVGFYALNTGKTWLFRGVAREAPAPVRDLAVRESTESSVTLSWTTPAGASRVEVRWSPQPIDDAAWFRAIPAKEQSAAGSVTVGGLDRGQVYYFALCAFGPKGERSMLSNGVRAATRPLRLARLVQGLPEPVLGVQSYAGCLDVAVQGGQPEPKSADGKGLAVARVTLAQDEVYSFDSYLRFDLGPLKGRTVRKAVLSVSMTAPYPAERATLIRCREVLAPWEPVSARFYTRDGSAKWADADYGQALINLETEPHTGEVKWDATAAVARLLKEGKTSLSLHFGGGMPQMHTSQVRLADSESKDPAARPALDLVLENDGK